MATNLELSPAETVVLKPGNNRLSEWAKSKLYYTLPILQRDYQAQVSSKI